MAAKFGILARGGGEAFQEMAQVDVIAFDKTGTLTEGGAPRVTNSEIILDALPTTSDEKRAYASRSGILGIADALESASSHPLATAIRSYCQSSSEQITRVTATDFEEVSGRGLKASLPNSGITAIIGNESWMSEHGVVMSNEMRAVLNDWKTEAKSVVLLALQLSNDNDYTLVAIFAIADTIRKEAKEVIRDLQRQGTAVWMISGDNSTTAKAVARTVGINESNVIADVLPHEKVCTSTTRDEHD
jgi:Cu+-exporting ATPase